MLLMTPAHLFFIDPVNGQVFSTLTSISCSGK